jgi:hypothetical protein
VFVALCLVLAGKKELRKAYTYSTYKEGLLYMKGRKLDKK